MLSKAGWLDAFSTVDSIDLLRELARHSAELSGNAGLGAHFLRLLREQRLKELCEYELPTDGSLTAHEYRYLRQSQAFFQKLEFLDLGIDKERAAVESFVAAEDRCRETNVIWQGMHDGWIKFDPDLQAVFHLAQGRIQHILGPRPSLERLKPRFGPGANTLNKRREASVKRKLGNGVSCSDDLIGWARALLQQMPHLAELHESSERVTLDRVPKHEYKWHVAKADYPAVAVEEVWGTVAINLQIAIVSFVRKNYKTDRTTETQPTLNGMLQLGIGDEMFDLASRVEGLDLRDQTLNRRLAKIGSLTGEVATLDLKSASNLIAVRLVQSLFPEDWFSLLKAARCGSTMLPGVGEIKLEMFSGMGNGFTFPLQSILFWSLARSCATYLKIDKPIVSVYGDDIIVDTAVVPLLKRVLACAGLLVNDQKSYTSGPFRESCGADFLSGIDVRPVFVKQMLTPAVLFTLHNGLRRRGFHELAELVEKYVHPCLRLYGPDGYGDGHLVSESWKSESSRAVRRHEGWEGLSFDTFSRIGKKDFKLHRGDRILHTYAVYTRAAEPFFDGIPAIDPQRGAPSRDVSVYRSWGVCRFVRAWVTGHGRCEEPSSAIPEGEERWEIDSFEGKTLGEIWYQARMVKAKAVTFPGEDGYKKIAIYTLGA